MLTFLLSTPMMYVWGSLAGILILTFIRKDSRRRKIAEAGYKAYQNVEKFAESQGWKGFEKSKPFREALDFILRSELGIEEPTPRDIAVATESMEKAVANEKLQRQKEESL
jgi:hypothetical protein